MSTARTKAIRMLQDVEVSRRHLRAATLALQTAMDQALAALVPIGTMIDNHAGREAPLWLRRVKTISGNDRGATVFETTTALMVEVDTSHPDLTKWRAKAYPISQKTGKRMSGRSHGADGQADQVTITGYFVEVPDTDLRGPAYVEHCIEHVLRVIDAGEQARQALSAPIPTCPS